MGAKGLAVVPMVLGGTILAAGEGPVYIGGGGVILALAGLFLRQFFQNQAATWQIANERREDNKVLREQLNRKDWDIARLHYRLGERDDPGPYEPLYPVSLDKEDAR